MSDLFGNHMVGFPTRWLYLSLEFLHCKLATSVHNDFTSGNSLSSSYRSGSSLFCKGDISIIVNGFWYIEDLTRVVISYEIY